MLGTIHVPYMAYHVYFLNKFSAKCPCLQVKYLKDFRVLGFSGIFSCYSLSYCTFLADIVLNSGRKVGQGKI